ncbi:16S rRNA (uracil(1498)-N(3))-methyltransferase [Psychrobacter sp. TAE2020]|uniref:16S rRNA (uracil(1498)-N(3))-methyltransferase n=1 Tax=Psychrobacter sp. TAE2020 TaxID=2846762 RepID=UPI001C10D1E6|nr:16S rRNA (uracil(1498)-N(3))-methyltransferase [Psychrobacter sp. TAE2020]MBU5615596.1 16S rRNA (uracil(1498)-N(3))-methyltransferase [Psychrobacter sp. TAE2020]
MRRFFYAANLDDINKDNNKPEDHNNNRPHYPKLNTLVIGASLILTETITHHWCRVLRANSGERGILFDGFGGEYLVELATISKKQATAILLTHNTDDRTAPFISKIGLVISRGERMDYAIQKSTELGVTAIQLLSSHHGEVHLKPLQVDKKVAHWQQVAIAACEQCGLNRPPLIIAPVSIDAWLQTLAKPSVDNTTNGRSDSHPSKVIGNQIAVGSAMTALSQDPYYQQLQQQADLSLMLSVPAVAQPLMPTTLCNVLAKPLPYINLLVGPEGGLSTDECQQAQQVGFAAWQIGTRVLRTETAPIVALATLHALSDL